MHSYVDNLYVVRDILNENKIILSPTDTVWGLGCSALSEEAVAKIYKVKNRPIDKSCILLVDSVALLKKYIVAIHPRIETLIHFHHRPLSVVYQANKNLPSYLTRDDNSIAIRVTKDPMLCDLIALLGCPLVSTSANSSGKETPRHFHEIESEIVSNVDYVFQSKRHVKDNNPPSMLIKFDEQGELIFLRK